MVATRKEPTQGSVRTLKVTITGESDLDCFYGKAVGFNKDIFQTQAPLLPTDVNKLVKILGDLGVQRVLVSGAEPLLRKDAPGFVKAANAHRNIREVRLVTNGTNLKSFADPLRKMGLKRIDLVHLDTFNFMKYQRITGKDCLYRVLDGIEKVEKLKYHEICLNVRLLNEINNDEIVEMARLTRSRKIHIRFMEYAPKFKNFDPYADRSTMTVLDAQRMIENYENLERVYDLEQDLDIPTYKFKDGPGKISFFSTADQEKDELTPHLQINPEGMLSHSFAPNRSIQILDQLRKDSKDPKLKKSIEKLLMTTRDSKAEATETERKSAAKSAKTASSKRKPGAEQSSRAA
jgi:cyclic pyranopterin phosphate synthase